MTILLFFVGLWLGYLILEALRLHRWREAIPVRIAVTGTRGKSSVVRMLASALREDGWRVLAKSTGAEAALILPDGSERRVKRRGPASILEQVGLVGLGARYRVDALVAEVMSVHAENHWVESQRILRPHLVLATNFRVDHLEAQGGSEDEVARVLALDVPAGSRVLVPEEELVAGFRDRVRRAGGRLQTVPAEGRAPGESPGLGPNGDLARAAAAILGAEREAVEAGIRNAGGDLGALRCWRVQDEENRRPWTVVNAFAANDPASTLLILRGLLGGRGEGEVPPLRKPVGLLLLRKDRGDRTALWVQALREGALSWFSHLYVHGFHARAVQRRLASLDGPGVEVLDQSSPEAVMRRVARGAATEGAGGGRGPGPFLFGFGNLGGLGERLVRHWVAVGRPVPLAQLGNPGPGGSRGS